MPITITMTGDTAGIDAALNRLKASVGQSTSAVEGSLASAAHATQQMSERSQRALDALSQSFRSSVVSIHAAMQANTAYAQSLKSIEDAALRAQRVLSSSILGGKALGGAGAESVASLQAAAKAGVAYSQSLASVTEAERKWRASQKETTQSTITLGSALKALAAGFGIGLGITAAIGAVKAFGVAMVDAALKMDTARLSLAAVTGSTKAAQAEMDALRVIADRTGVGIDVLAQQWAGLFAAVSQVPGRLQETRGVFDALIETGVRLGKSTSQIEQALYGLTQLAGGATVQLDELARQLGDQLPGLMPALAREMGVTAQELRKMATEGKLLVDDVLPKMEKAIRSLASGSGPVSTLQASFGYLRTAWIDFLDAIGQLGPILALQGILVTLTGTLKGVAAAARDAKGALFGLSEATVVANSLQSIQTKIDEANKSLANMEQASTTGVGGLINRLMGLDQQKALATKRQEIQDLIAAQTALRESQKSLGPTEGLPAPTGAEQARTKLIQELEARKSTTADFKKELEGINKELDAIHSKDVGILLAVGLDPLLQSFERDQKNAETRLLKARAELLDKMAGIDKGAGARAVQEAGESAIEIAKAREDALATSLKREEAMIKQSADEQRRIEDEAVSTRLAAEGPGAVEAIAADRLRNLRTITEKEAAMYEAARLANLEQDAKAREIRLQAEIAGAGKNLSAATKAQEELRNLNADTETARLVIRAKTEDMLQKAAKKSADEQIEQARKITKVIQDIEHDRISARIDLAGEQMALVKSQMDGEVTTTQDGLAQIQALEQQRFADIRLRYQEEAQIAIDAVNVVVQRTKEGTKERVDAELLASTQIAQIHEGLTAQLASVNVQQQTQQQEHLNELTQGWRDWVKDIKSELGDFLFRWMDGQITSMKDVLLDLKSYFFRLIADMVAYAASKAIVIPIVTAVLGGLGGGVGNALGAAFGIPGLGNLLGAGGAAGGITGGGSSGGGLGALQGLGILASLKTIGSGFMDALGGLTDSLVNAVSSISQTFGGPAIYAPGFVGPVPAGGISTAAGTTGGAVLGAAGGLAAIGAGIYGALNASNNAAKAAYAASAAAGAAAAATAAISAGLLGAAAATAVGTGWTGIGLIVAAVMAVIGVVLDRVIKPAGPSLSVRAGGGLSIGTDGGQLAVQGDLGSRVTRREGVDRGMAEGVQAQLEAGLTSAVKSIMQTINAVALDPAKLAGPTNEALQRALAAVQPINSANAKKMAEDISEQLRFANIQLVGGMLEPINMAFEQLVDSDLKTQMERLPGTTMGLVDLFKNLNSQLDEMAKGENRDVLGQIQGTREAIERFGVRLAMTAGDTAEQIVNSVITQFDDAIERTQPLKLVSDFSHNLATLITTFNERMTDGLTALVTLQKTQKTLEDAGLSGAGVGSQAERLSAELAQQGEIFSTQIVTRALENLSSELDKIVIQPIQIQATTVDSLFSDSLAALNSLWLEWHRLEDAGIDATRIQEQFTKLLGGILESSKTLLTDALQRGTFPEFLDVLLSIPDALAKMNPVFERLKALGQAFAQVVGPVQQAISQREEQLRTPTERVDRTAQQMRELEAAIADAGTSAEKALPLYAQLGAAITANAEAQIAVVQQVGAVIEQITAILDARLTTSQRLAQVNQQIADLQAGRRPGEQTGVTPPWVRISEVTPPPSTGPQTIEDITQLVTLYGQQLDLMKQLIDAIQSGLDSIDQTLRADETVGQRAARLVAAATPRQDILRPAIEASPETLLRQASALQEAIGAVRELIDVIEQGLQNIADILHANETVSERAARLVDAVTRAVPSQDPEALIRLASGIGDALTAVRALIDAIQQGLQHIQDILHATETATERAVRLVGAVPSTQGVTDPEALITIAGQIGEALTAVRALTDLLQGGIDSIDSTLFSLLSVAEQSVDLQAKIAAINTDIAHAGAATPEQLITLVGLTQQALSLQQQITQALESTLADLQSSFATTGSPASQLTDTRAQIDALQTLADTGSATPEQLQQLVDLNQQLLSLGTQFDLLDVQQEALDALKSLAPVIQDQIDASKSQEQLLTDSLIAIQDQLEAQLVVAQTTDAHLVAQLTDMQISLKAQLEVAQSTEAQLVAQLVGIQTALLIALAVASDTETQLVIQLTAVQAILRDQLERLHNDTLITEDLLRQQLGQLTQQLLAQYGTANIQDIIRRIQEWQLDELRDLNTRLKDLFLQQPEAQALFGIQTTLTGQTTEMSTQTAHLRSIDDETNTVINKLDEIFKQLERPLRTTPAQSGGFLYASLNRAATGPLGYAAGGMVSAILEPGERVFPPPFSPAQTHALMTMNTAFPRFAGGGWMVPGSGDGDHVPVGVTSGSFVLNREASTALTHTPRPMSGLRLQHGGVVSGPESRTAQASTTNHVTITIQVYQQPGQSGRELVDLITRQLKKEFRTRNDDSPFR